MKHHITSKPLSAHPRLLIATCFFFTIALCIFMNNAFAEQKSIKPEQFLKMPSSDRLLLDVRTKAEYQDGYIADAINIPVAELSENMSTLDNKDQQIVVYCRSGRRASNAIEYLSSQGYTNVIHLEGDFGQWEAKKREITKPSK